MTLQDQLDRLSPWTVITLIGCLALAMIDAWRDMGATSFPLLRGTLPNAVAVPTLTFGLLMTRSPVRVSFDSIRMQKQNRWFWSCWAGALAVTVGWEFMQRTGRLVFDWNDLIATVVGAALAVVLFLRFRRCAFRAAE